MTNSNITHLWQRYQIKINLVGAKPPIWRRLIVDSRVPLDALHTAIQISMGWTDSHLHQFVDNENNIYGMPDDEFDYADINDENDFLISDILFREKQSINYDYDFGDDWRHKITLEKILPADNKQPQIQCIKGMRICPIEDSGGIWGYQRLLDMLKDPKNEEYDDIREWFGDEFDADAKFDLQSVQLYLNEYFSDIKFTGKKSKNQSKQKDLAKQDSIPDLDDNFEPSMLLNDPDMPDELKMIFRQLLSSMDVIEEMGDMIEACYQAFEQISEISNDKKIIKVAKKMIKQIDQDY